MMTRLPIQDFRLDEMTADDFKTVAMLGETIWRQHYAQIISNEQIDYMLSGRYTPDSLRLYLNANDRWLMILRISGKPVGYCSYALTKEPGEMKIEQLYLLPNLHGMGWGKLMLDHIEEQARLANLGTLKLQVNKQNTVALNFYRKNGFNLCEEAVFDIGNGFVMDDYVMNKFL